MSEREHDQPVGEDPIVAEALQRFKYCSEAEDPQRKSIMLAKKFRAGDQWDDQVKAQRMGGPAIQGEAAQPARPCLTIDRVSQPVRQVSNTVKQANIAATVVPNGGGATKETAEILKDWMRRVQNDARSEAPIEWAADQAAEGGLGWFRLRTEFVEATEGPELFDQDAKLCRIANNLTVYCDPSNTHPTRRTARFMFVTEDTPRSEFKRAYPKSKLTTLDEFRSTGDGEGWTTEDTIRVAEYWKLDYERLRAVQLQDGSILVGDQIPKELDKDQIKHDRVVLTPKVMCYKITSVEVLDKYEWVGTRIPLFPIQGEELNVDGKMVRRGVIQPAMDAQRMVNYTYTAAIETAADAPKSPWIATAASIANYKPIWQESSTKKWAYMPWDEYSDDGLGQKNTPPFRSDSRADIAAHVELMIRSEEAVKATTGIFDPTLGNSNPREKSGKAIVALQAQSEHGNSTYLENVKMTVLDLATEMVAIAPKILDRPGRVLAILGIDDQPEHVMLGQPFEPGQDGQPKAMLDRDGNPMSPDQMATLEKGIAKFYDVTKGRFGVTVNTSKSFVTRQQEGTQMLGELIPNLPPEMAAAITPEFIRGLDFPNSEKIADIAQQTLPPNLQGAMDQDGQEMKPEQAKAVIAQLKQQMEQMGQELDKANKGIPKAQIDAQTKLQSQQMSAQATMQQAQLEAQAAERQSLLDAKLDMALETMKQQGENFRALLALHAKGISEDKQHAHEDDQMADQAAVTLATSAEKD